MRPLYLWVILPILVFLSSSFSTLLLGQCEGDILVVINEIGNVGGGNTGEYVELLVVGDPNNPESTVNLSGWIIDDNNASVLYKGNEPGHIRLGDCFSSVEPGTLILIYDDEREVTGVSEGQDGMPNANGVYQIPFNSACVLKIEGCPSHSSQNYCTETVIDPSEPVFTNYASHWNKFIPMRNAGDVLQLLSPDGTLVHSLYWGDLNQETPPNNYPFKDSDRSLSMTSTAEKKAFYLTSSAWNNAAAYGGLPGGESPGEPNSPENQAFINSILEGDVFGGAMTIECLVQQHVQGEELGIIEIEIIGGLSSYNIELLTHAGQESSTVLADNEGITEITDLEAGDYEITVTDGRGCEQSCELTIEDLCEDEYTICPGESVQIGCLISDEYCYKWEPEEGLDNPTIPRPTASPEQTTTYTLYVIDDNGNIVETHEATVNVEVGAEVLIIPENPMICSSTEPVNLEADIWGNDNDYSFRWSTGEMTTSILVDMPGVYIVTVVNNLSQCSSMTEVEVGAALQNLTIISDADELCEGQNIELESSLQGEEYIFEWSTAESTPSISVAEAGIYALTVSLSGTECRYIAEHTLTPSDQSLVFLPLTPIVCDGKSIELSVEGDYLTYEWTYNNGQNTANTPTLIVSSEMVTDDPVFNLTVTDITGCAISGNIEVQNASDPAAILAWLEAKGFYSIDIDIPDDVMATSQGGRSSDDPCAPLCDNPAIMGSCVKDDAELVFSINGGDVINLYDEVKTNLDYFEAQFGYERSRAYISRNENWCACTETEYYEKIEGYFANANMAYWIHLYEAGDGGQDKLFILANMPSSGEYYPDADNRATVLDIALPLAQQDLDDGSTGTESHQQVFVLMDLNTDNFLDASPFGEGLPNAEGPSNDLPICSNADMGGKVGLSPAGIPILLPDMATARFIPHEDYATASPDGALTGFTDFSLAAQNDGLLLYYSARVNVSGLPVSSPVFEGYFRNNYRGAALDAGSYLSYAPPIPTVVTLGELEPELPQTPEEVHLFDYEFLWDEYENDISSVTYPNTGEGQMISGSFPENWLNGFAGPPLIVNISLDEITEINFSNTEIHSEYGVAGIVYQIEQENGETAYILVVLIDGELIVSQWNCYTGEYQEITESELPDEVRVQIEADLTSLQNDKTNEGTENESLGKEFCFEITAEQAGNLPTPDPLNNNFPSSENVRNLAGIDIADFQDAANKALARYGCSIYYIVTGDARVPLDANPPSLPENYQGAKYEFDNLELSSEDPTKADALFWVHIRNNGSVGFCLRLAEDLFKHTTRDLADEDDAVGGQLPDDVALEIENLLIERIRSSLFYLENPSEIIDDVGNCAEEDGCADATANETPWSFGRREGNNEAVTFLSVSKEIVGLGKGFMKELKIPEKLCRGTAGADATMMEIPEVVLGATNIIVEENPIVGAIQLGTMAWSFVENKQTREAIIEIVRHPKKTAQAFYKDKKAVYSGEQGPEKMLQSAGEDGATIVVAIWSGGGALLARAKVKDLGKEAKGSSQKLSDEIGGHPDDIDFNDLPNDPFYKQFDDFSEAEIIDYHKYMGKFSTATRKKMTDNPWLARMWKEFKDDADFCPFGFQGGGGSDQRNPCINFDDFLKRCPDSPAEFYAKFKEVFLVPGTDRIADPQKIESLLKDIDGNNGIFDEFKARPELLNSWDFAFNAPVARINLDILKSISIALGRSLREMSEVVTYAGHPNITNYTVTHIFRGHGIGGHHHIASLIADNTKKLKGRTNIGGDGFYKANIEVNGILREDVGFFPDEWGEFRVIDEVKHAWENKQLIDGTYYGYTTTGQKLKMTLNNQFNNIQNAYPIFN